VDAVDPNGEMQDTQPTPMEAGVAAMRAQGAAQADWGLRSAQLADAESDLQANQNAISTITSELGPEYQRVRQLTATFNHYNEMTMFVGMETVFMAGIVVMLTTGGAGTPAVATAIVVAGTLELVGAAVTVWSAYVTNAVANDLSTAYADLISNLRLLRYVHSLTPGLQAKVARAQALLDGNAPG
jgi:hypothetical protein